MKLILTGPQGCGKGTQAKFISQNHNIPHICTGDLFRELTGDLKQEVDEIMNKGNLVPDELTLKILKQRLEKPDAKNGFILDGYPRNLNQTKLLETITNINKIIEITLSDQEAIKRLSSRLSCPKCKAVFNTITNPPKQENICDNCQTTLFQRNDDKPEAIQKRLNIYKEQTEPIIQYYKDKNINVLTINGEQSIEDIKSEIEEKLK